MRILIVQNNCCHQVFFISEIAKIALRIPLGAPQTPWSDGEGNSSPFPPVSILVPSLQDKYAFDSASALPLIVHSPVCMSVDKRVQLIRGWLAAGCTARRQQSVPSAAKTRPWSEKQWPPIRSVTPYGHVTGTCSFIDLTRSAMTHG